MSRHSLSFSLFTSSTLIPFKFKHCKFLQFSARSHSPSKSLRHLVLPHRLSRSRLGHAYDSHDKSSGLRKPLEASKYVTDLRLVILLSMCSSLPQCLEAIMLCGLSYLDNNLELNVKLLLFLE